MTDSQLRYPLQLDATSVWEGTYEGIISKIKWDSTNKKAVPSSYTQTLVVKKVESGFYSVSNASGKVELGVASVDLNGGKVLSTTDVVDNETRDYVPVLQGNKVAGFVRVGLQSQKGANAQFGNFQRVSDETVAPVDNKDKKEKKDTKAKPDTQEADEQKPAKEDVKEDHDVKHDAKHDAKHNEDSDSSCSDCDSPRDKKHRDKKDHKKHHGRHHDRHHDRKHSKKHHIKEGCGCQHKGMSIDRFAL